EATEATEAEPESKPVPEPEPEIPAEPLAADPEVVAPEPLPLWQPEAAVMMAAPESELAPLPDPAPAPTTTDPVVALPSELAAETTTETEVEPAEEAKSKKTGWWRR
ncbi:MAG: signal recognition particle-docking protein FtsY, partial [Alphaproteobacteria bacterium]|nr:signal recognition particle-docking protein FtsY [Alphaproteobacteria bacterium]